MPRHSHSLYTISLATEADNKRLKSMINYVTNGHMGLLRALQHSLTIIFSLLLCARGVYAQLPTNGATPLAIAPGSPAGSYSLSGFEDVNLYNGNLNIQLPLLKVSGRGGAQYVMTHMPIPYRWMIDHLDMGFGVNFNTPVHSWSGEAHICPVHERVSATQTF